MVERAGEHLDAAPVQCTCVDVLDLAVSDIAARTTAIARGLTQAEERRGAVAGSY